jgi:hypothetical protein
MKKKKKETRLHSILTRAIILNKKIGFGKNLIVIAISVYIATIFPTLILSYTKMPILINAIFFCFFTFLFSLLIYYKYAWEMISARWNKKSITKDY